MTPSGLDEIAAHVSGKATGSSRLLVAVAGPPGAGKSTLAEKLRDRLNAVVPDSTIIVPMDGFHFDNVVLDARGLLHRKGAPETFDAAGYVALMQRIVAHRDEEIAIPVFDRHLDLARAGAAIVAPNHHVVIAEGNYLLSQADPWKELAVLFGLTIWLDVADAELEQRLIRRWLHHGLRREAAVKRALDNDMPNARLVKQRSRPADLLVEV